MGSVSTGVGHEAKGVRVIPIGAYGIGSEQNESTKSIVWKRGEKVDDDRLKSQLLK